MVYLHTYDVPYAQGMHSFVLICLALKSYSGVELTIQIPRKSFVARLTHKSDTPLAKPWGKIIQRDFLGKKEKPLDWFKEKCGRKKGCCKTKI